MFKRLFFLSGIIAFLLSCALMYFWYLPNHPTEKSVSTEQEVETIVDSTKLDSPNTATPLE
ncbi:MAG: hypothetical protein K9G41_01335 [Flavobacteriales bacterium]|nr:hypothetical protein [Flavobacteriales bacterium]